MYVNRNFQLLESNQCPDCMSPYFKSGTGYDRGIHCNNCGYTVPIEKYREVMKAYFARMSRFDEQEDNQIEK